jgi:hypothetical protein
MSIFTKKKTDNAQQAPVKRSELESDLATLQKQDPDCVLRFHELNLSLLLPELVQKSKNPGKKLSRIVIEVLDEYLGKEEDRYVLAGPAQYLLYLCKNRKVAQLKIKTIEEEICRRVDPHNQNNSESDFAVSGNAEESQSPEAAAKWSPPREARQKQLPLDPEQQKMATLAMQGMLATRERNNYNFNYQALANDMDVLYQPILNVPRNCITAYKAKHSTTAFNDSSFNDSIARRNSRGTRDIALLIRSARDLEACLKNNERAVLIIPVSLDTLNRFPFREYFLQNCRDLPESVRSHIVLQVLDVPKDFPAWRFREIVEEPAKLVRNIILKSEIKRTSFSNLAKCGSHAISFSLKTTCPDEGIVVQLLNRFAVKTDEINCQAMAEDVPTASLLESAIAAGYTYVSGPAVGMEQASLQGMRVFNRDSFEDDRMTEYVSSQDVASSYAASAQMQ